MPRKYKSKKFIKLTKREFYFEVDQWYARFNKNYNKIKKPKKEKTSILEKFKSLLD